MKAKEKILKLQLMIVKSKLWALRKLKKATEKESIFFRLVAGVVSVPVMIVAIVMVLFTSVTACLYLAVCPALAVFGLVDLSVNDKGEDEVETIEKI